MDAANPKSIERPFDRGAAVEPDAEMRPKAASTHIPSHTRCKSKLHYLPDRPFPDGVRVSWFLDIYINTSFLKKLRVCHLSPRFHEMLELGTVYRACILVFVFIRKEDHFFSFLDFDSKKGH